MFDTLLIHPRTRMQLELFIKNPSHGLILTGPEGSGKKALAKAVAAALIDVTDTKLAAYPYYSVTDPSDPTITIDEIRGLQKLLTLKTPSHDKHSVRRIVTIIDAGRMRHEAQNAFLKSLEEPPLDTCIILTAEANGDLLDTMYSRVQRIDVLPVAEAAAKEFFTAQGVSSVDLAKTYALSQGQVGLLCSLLDTNAVHPLKASVETAKQILSKSASERLQQTEELSKDKPQIHLLLNALSRICHAALVSSSKSSNTAAAKRWQNSLDAVQNASNAMVHNANTKLLLDHLFLTL